MTTRFGEIPSDLIGSANQQLKVNSGGTAFEMVNPPTLPSYTITNDSADRAMNAADVTLDELANVLSTLIKDLATLYDGGAAAFQWSTSEQVWPFEKTSDGSTLYAKEIAFGALPNNGVKSVAHNISNFLESKVFAVYVHYYKDGTRVNCMPDPYWYENRNDWQMNSTNFVIPYLYNMSDFDAVVRVIYKH